MTGYYIELGYLSGSPGPADRDQAWTELKHVATMIRHRPNSILDEVMRVEAHRKPEDRGKLWGFIERYHPRFEDATIKVTDPEGETPGSIVQLASGGNEDRRNKESVRRAFCRLVIQEMQRRGIKVNLRVA